MRRPLHPVDGRKIALLRDARGMNGVQFARKLGITGGYLWNIEFAGRQPSPSLRVRIIAELGVTYADIAPEAHAAVPAAA